MERKESTLVLVLQALPIREPWVVLTILVTSVVRTAGKSAASARRAVTKCILMGTRSI